ncbi:hypothetical protein JoomaDRAFT_0741 [Galbibacter orientalis DSM 19592]|uniref:Terminase small subunit n=2 Tax=Galbibacter TaxID=379068 RepID=I3C2D2_9FLAO|nr:hypothetical protein JoomaDRAFT_0741 [Galbibacter orientalis DSM 19592]
MTDKTFIKYKTVIDEWFVNGRNGTKAYQAVYPKANANAADIGFRKIYGNLRIREYVQTKVSEVSQKLDVTFENQLQDLEDIKVESKKESKYSDAIAAIKEQNKMLGFYEKDNNQKKIDNVVIFQIPDNGRGEI